MPRVPGASGVSEQKIDQAKREDFDNDKCGFFFMIYTDSAIASVACVRAVVFIVSHLLPEAPTLEDAEKVRTILFFK